VSCKQTKAFLGNRPKTNILCADIAHFSSISNGHFLLHVCFTTGLRLLTLPFGVPFVQLRCSSAFRSFNCAAVRRSVRSTPLQFGVPFVQLRRTKYIIYTTYMSCFAYIKDKAGQNLRVPEG